MRKRLCNGDLSFMPMPLVSSVKDQSRLPKSVLVGGQCLDRVTLCLKSFAFNVFYTCVFLNRIASFEKLKNNNHPV